MNIFVLDNNPELAAKYHCDKHVVKMIIESAQLLSTTLHIQTGWDLPNLYKPCFHNHPCRKWLDESQLNFQWLLLLLKYLLYEYELRYKKEHKTKQVYIEIFMTFLHLSVEKMDGWPVTNNITPFALAMPDKYKSDDAVVSYRNYYLGEKKFAQWNHGPKPDWWI